MTTKVQKAVSILLFVLLLLIFGLSLHFVWPAYNRSSALQLIRTDLSGGRRTYTTPVPFLYDGHNIYGYIRATLGKQNRN